MIILSLIFGILGILFLMRESYLFKKYYINYNPWKLMIIGLIFILSSFIIIIVKLMCSN